MAYKFPIFNKYFIILILVNFSVAFSYYITFVTTASYAINVLNTSWFYCSFIYNPGFTAFLRSFNRSWLRLIFSGGQSYALLNAPKNKLGLATSTYYIFLDIGGGIGPYIFGFAGQSLGYKAMYQICAGLVFIVLILYFFLIFKRKNCW